MAHELTDEQWASIKTALTGGSKIEAIKLYREYTGAALVEAKQAVEKLEAGLRSDSPEQFKTKEGKGCSRTALLAIVIGLWFVIF